MDQLIQKVDKLSLEVEQLRNSTPQNTRRYGDALRQNNSVLDTKCKQCHGRGHSDHNCRWNREGRLTPDVKCQICKQVGHQTLTKIQMICTHVCLYVILMLLLIILNVHQSLEVYCIYFYILNMSKLLHCWILVVLQISCLTVCIVFTKLCQIQSTTIVF